MEATHLCRFPPCIESHRSDMPVTMVQQALELLFAVSWTVLSNVAVLGARDFDSRDAPSAPRSPSTGKPVKLANDQVELTSRILERGFRSSDLENNTWIKLTELSLEPGALRSHKDNCVFLI